MAATLNDLLPIRGQLALGLEAYLHSFVDLSAWATAPAFLLLPTGLSQETAALDLYQAPDVLNHDRLDPEVDRLRNELDARGEFRRGARSPRPEPWITEREKIGCSVILGRPGEGKTLLTRLTCHDIAAESLKRLRARSRPVSEIPIPIWLRLEDILRAAALKEGHPHYDRSPIQGAVNATVPGIVADAIDRFYPHPAQRPTPGIASRFITARLQEASTWLFIDALDERGSAPEAASYTAALSGLAQLPVNHVVVTCRRHEYDRRRKLPLEPPAGWLREYDLEPLREQQQRAFVNRWFGTDSADASDVLALIDSHDQFRDMASNGLMLTLICATRERHAIGPGTRRVQLYELVLHDMVSRARQPNPLGSNDPEIGLRLHVLEEIVWPFFERRADNNAMPVVEWRKALIAHCRDLGVAFQPFEDDLKREGLLVSHAAGAYRFLHRSFFEYVAASRLARQGAEAVTEALRRHLDDEHWREPLIMAIGCLALTPRAGLARRSEDVAEAQAATAWTVDRVIAAPAGAPGRAIALVGEAIAEAGSELLPTESLDRLRLALLRTMRSDGIDGRDPYVPPKVRAAAGSALGRIGDPRFHGPETWCLPRYLSDLGPDGQLQPDDLLGFVDIPAGEFWMGSNTE